MDSGDFKRGWGGHGMPLDEITNDSIPGYDWDGSQPPTSGISYLRYISSRSPTTASSTSASAARTACRSFKKTALGSADIYVAAGTPAERLGPTMCGGVTTRKELPACGTMYRWQYRETPMRAISMSRTRRTRVSILSTGRAARRSDRSVATAATRTVTLDQCDRDRFRQQHLHGRSRAR